MPGEAFWSLYETPDMIRSGFEDSPARLRDLIAVRCQLTTLTRLDPSRAVAQVSIEALTTLDELIALPLVQSQLADALWQNFHPVNFEWIVRQGDLVHIECNFEGDDGAWAILRDTPEATDLLLLAEWGEHEDHLWCGRVRVRQGTHMIGSGLPPLLR